MNKLRLITALLTITVVTTFSACGGGSGSGSGGGKEQGETEPGTQKVTLTISSTEEDQTHAYPIPVTFTFSKAVTGFEAADVLVSNGSMENLNGSGTTYTANLVPDSEGVLNVSVEEGAVQGENDSINESADFSIVFDMSDFRTIHLTGLTVSSSSITCDWADTGNMDHVEITFSDDANNHVVNVASGVQTVHTDSIDGVSISGRKNYTMVLKAVSNLGTSITTDPIMVRTPNSGDYSYTPVASAADLDNVRNDLGGNYLQTADIDLSSYASWVPIGDFSDNFSGSFAGNGFAISRLTINAPAYSSYQGFFGYTYNAILCGIHLSEVSISASSCVGGLIGFDSRSKILNCSSSGSIYGDEGYVGGLIGLSRAGVIENSFSSGEVTAAEEYAGGLIGEMTNQSSYQGLVRKSYSTANVHCGRYTAGGLIGFNECSIVSCYATGSVNASGNKAAGLIGEHTYGDIQNCYSTGAVNGEEYVGGLVGYAGSGTSISNCYSISSIRGEKFFGGLVGYNSADLVHCYAAGWVDISAATDDYYIGGLTGIFHETIESCYYDADTTTMSDTGKGEGKNTPAMKLQSTYTADPYPDDDTKNGWDFVGETDNGTEDIWAIDAAINDGYPYLVEFADSYR